MSKNRIMMSKKDLIAANCFQHILESEKFRLLGHALTHLRRIPVSGLTPSSKAFFLSLLFKLLPLPALIVTPTLEKAEALFEDLQFFMHLDHRSRIELFDEKDTWDPAGALSPRLNVVQGLSQGEPNIIISSLRALLQKIEDGESLRKGILSLRGRQVISPIDICRMLAEAGYERVSLVEKRSQYSLRGCILDIFPITGEPVRLEFWGDEIESMRRFEIETQRSVSELTDLQILPAGGGTSTTSLIEYLPPSSWIIIDEPAHAKLTNLDCCGESDMVSWEELEKYLDTRRNISLSSWSEEEIHFNTALTDPFYGKIVDFVSRMGELREERRTIIVSSQASRLKEILEESNVPFIQDCDFIRKGEILVRQGSLSEGFFFEPDLHIITDREILGMAKRAVVIKPEKHEMPIRLEDLSPGSTVVHILHGIGIYKGLVNLKIHNTHKEFILIEYARGDKLYVPIGEMDLIQKFNYIDSKKAQLSRLGGKEWVNTRSRVRERVREIARKLLELYAVRDSCDGFSFSTDTPWQGELESSFPFDETPDQLKAIELVKQDMERSKPMDRLICGDAGYGKTEVALRSAFKAIMDGKQVAILVPTTILAEQHYTTFRERLTPYPARVEMLSRFKSEKEQKEILDMLGKGAIDIIIGTHRLLQKDVEFKDLGLLVIDEEQHFGVEHKERLKELKNRVDCITLTATPIPRTLYLTLSGIRDMSVINTPPENRLAVKTYIFEYQKDVVKGAILRELERGGQVYFIHNRVRGIEAMARNIEKMVPGARVIYAHGQMTEERLERIMRDFINGAYDILLCTTIIESGIDIPNVNTIIINNAYGFGLAQLYQLRGRVGRSHRQAYAYLLYPGHRKLGEMARKRMEILKDFSDLGAGFHIAMKDLELRGAGTILGAEQHGFVSEVGFDLYCQLLEEAVKELKGETPAKAEILPQIDLPLPAYLPADYVPDDRQKITLYKRMATLRRREEIGELEAELKDRFGPLPREALNLLALISFRIGLLRLGAVKMKYDNEKIIIQLPPGKSVSRERLSHIRKDLGIPAEQKENCLIIPGILGLGEWMGYLTRLLESLTRKAPYR